MSGRAVINANFPPGSFINRAKLARDQSVSGTYAFPGILDANGYPVSSPEASIAQVVDLIRGSYTGSWVVGWTGQLGGFLLNLASGSGLTVTTGASFVSQGGFNNTFSGANGRVVFSFNGADASPTCYFVAGTYDGSLANFYICREDEESLYLSGVHTSPDYQSILEYLDPLVIRFLNIMPRNGSSSNGTSLSRYGYNNTTSTFTYGSRRWQPTAWAGTVGDTDTYTCSAATDTPGSWTDGEILQGQFTNANTSTTPTIDAGSRGAKTLIRNTGAALSVGEIGANSIKTLMYDGLLDKVLCHPGGLSAGMPLDTAVQLCNSLNKPGWFLVPLGADDAYILAMAQYLYANMNQWFVLELDNEIWNLNGVFTQTFIAAERGLVLGFGSGDNRRIHGYYAKRFCEMVDIFKTVFGSDTRLRPTLGVQMAGTVSQYNTYRFLGTDLGAWGLDTSPNRPIDKATYVSPASYLSGAQISNFDGNWDNTMTEALAAADDYDSGDATRMADALLWVDGDIRAGTRNSTPGTETVTAIATKAAAWNTQVATYGKGLLEYEGGLEIAAPSTSRLTALSIDTGYSAKFAALIEGYKNSHFAKKLMMDRMQGFMANSMAIAPACYDDVRNGQWALRPSIYGTPYKTEEGFAKFSAGKLNFRLGVLT